MKGRGKKISPAQKISVHGWFLILLLFAAETITWDHRIKTGDCLATEAFFIIPGPAAWSFMFWDMQLVSIYCTIVPVSLVQIL